MPELEGTGRIARQFSQLLRGITLLRGLDEPHDPEVRIIERVAIGSLPPARLKVLEELPFSGSTVRALADSTGIPKSVLGRTLQDMALLGVVKVTDSRYVPKDDQKQFFLTARQISAHVRELDE